MSTIRQNEPESYTNFKSFAKLVYLPTILRRINLTRNHGFKPLALIVDDTPFPRANSYHSEGVAKDYDHANHTYYRGFKALTLGWSDTNTLLPLMMSLVSSTTDRTPFKSFKLIMIVGKRRELAMCDKNSVTLTMIDQACLADIKASYVLCDSWYASPKMMLDLRQRNLHGVAMFKRNNTYFLYRGRHYTLG